MALKFRWREFHRSGMPSLMASARIERKFAQYDVFHRSFKEIICPTGKNYQAFGLLKPRSYTNIKFALVLPVEFFFWLGWINSHERTDNKRIS
jgi:hypothetical protein